MPFSKPQKESLEASLDRSHVKQRKQGGMQVSYVEGWHAIAEANRIFGFHAWDRVLSKMTQLHEPREVDGKFRVAYMATVRISVRTEDEEITRDGTGYGSGIDRDVGSAHESAIKEAETDAMKRALMTFGNPFGLALYDDAAPPPVPVLDRLIAMIAKADDMVGLGQAMTKPAVVDALNTLSPADYQKVRDAEVARKLQLEKVAT